MNIVSGVGLHGPVGMPVVVERDAGGENVFQLAGAVVTDPAMAALVGCKAIEDGAVGGLLQVEVEGGFNLQAGLVDLLGAEALLELLARLLLEPGSDGHLRLGRVQAERGIAGRFGLGVGDGMVLLHLGEDKIAAAQGLVGIGQGRKGRGRLGKAGQQSRFGQVEIAGALGEIELRGSLEAIHSMAEVNLVAVEGEYLFLGEAALDLDGQIGLLELAGGGALGGEEEVARQLHGERGCALSAAVVAQVVPDGPHDAKDVDAPVGLEALVFNGDDGLAQDGGKVVVADDLAALQSKGADDAALAVIEIGGGVGAVMLEIVDLGQIDGVNQGEAGQRAGYNRKEEQGGKRKPAGELAAAVDGDRLHLPAAGPDKVARFQTLWGRGSQTIQASWALPPMPARKRLSSRLAF